MVSTIKSKDVRTDAGKCEGVPYWPPSEFAIARASVDLPEPDGPHTPTTNGRISFEF